MFKRKLFKNFFSLVIFLFLIPSVLAVKEAKTISYFGGYVADVDANTPYSKTFIFKAPDGISQLYYAKIIIRADMTNTNTQIYAKMEDEFCTPNYYNIPTNEKNYVMMFDCTEIMKEKGEGQFEGGFQSTKNIKNVYVEFEFTYLNNPAVEIEKVYEEVKTKLNIFGTEYQAGDEGKLFLQLLVNNNPVTNASCFLTTFYPDNTKFLDDASMSLLPNSNAVYYLDFTVPFEIGVYPTTVICYYTTNQENECADSSNLIHGTVISGTYLDICEQTGSHKIKEEQVGNQEYFEIDYNFNNFSFPEESLPSKITEIFYWTWNDQGDNVSFYVWDYNLNDWVLRYKSGEITVQIHFTSYDNVTDFLNKYVQEGILKVKVKSDDNNYTRPQDLGTVEIYQIIYRLTFFEPNYTKLEGSTEVHVSQNALVSFIGATEYTSGEMGTFTIQFLQAIAGNPKPLNDAICSATLFYPNKTIWKTINLNYLPNSNGIYYNISTIPDVLGVYIIDANCTKPQGNSKYSGYSSGTFHVSKWAEGIMNMTINGTLINEYYLLFAGGTEYKPNEQGTFVVQFLRTVAGNPSPVSGGTCSIDIYFPNMTLWKSLSLPEVSGSNALYYNNTIVPEVYGVYTIDAVCTKGGIKAYNSHTFHVASWAREIYNITDIILAHNQSVWNKLYLIQEDLQNISNQLIQVNITVGNITFNTTELEELIKSHNSTIMNKLYSVQNELSEINQSIENHDINVINNLTNILNELSDITIYLQGHNSTVMLKLYKIQDELASINDTIKTESGITQQLIISHNETVMNKLYKIQEELQNITLEINTTWMDLRSYIHTRYLDLKNDIYNLEQKWIDLSKDTLDKLLGSANALERILSQTTGVTPACSLTDRILGRC